MRKLAFAKRYSRPGQITIQCGFESYIFKIAHAKSIFVTINIVHIKTFGLINYIGSNHQNYLHPVFLQNILYITI